MSSTPDRPDREPRRFVAGTTIVWEKDLPEYPAGDWTLTYHFRGPGPGFDKEASAIGTTHLIEIDAETSAKCTAGEYTWQSFVTKDSQRFPIEKGRAACERDLATVQGGGYDGRSLVKQTLDAIRAAILGNATANQQRFMVGDKEIWRATMPELLAAETRFTQLYNAEKRRRRRRPLLKTVRTSFNRP